MASLNIAGVRKPAAKGHGGAHVAHHKNTSAMPVERMPVPASVTIPLSQHIGAPNEAQVKVGDVVKVGQVIGSTDAFVSAPVHATISGTVKAIKPVRIVNGVRPRHPSPAFDVLKRRRGVGEPFHQRDVEGCGRHVADIRIPRQGAGRPLMRIGAQRRSPGGVRERTGKAVRRCARGRQSRCAGRRADDRLVHA